MAFLAEGSPTSSATVDVTGAGSTWTNNTGIIIGEAGTATVTVENIGSISAPTITIADQAQAVGQLQIGNNDTGGTITASAIQFGSGNGNARIRPDRHDHAQCGH